VIESESFPPGNVLHECNIHVPELSKVLCLSMRCEEVLDFTRAMMGTMMSVANLK
jgi:hypothetical protein